MAKKILTVIVTVLLLAVILLGVCYWVGWRAEQSRRKLVVRFDGKVVDNLTGLSASGSEPLVFTVSGYDYTVKIVPAEKVNISYQVNGIEQKMSDISDCTVGFRIDSADNGTVTVTPCGSLTTILSTIHNADVIAPDDIDVDQDLFTVVFTQGQNEYRASFGLLRYDVSGVKLSKEGLVF